MACSCAWKSVFSAGDPWFPREPPPCKRGGLQLLHGRLKPCRGVAWLVAVRGRRADGLQLRLEERLVDLAVVDRHPFLAADLEDFLAVDLELLRQLLGRQVVGHRVSFCSQT